MRSSLSIVLACEPQLQSIIKRTFAFAIYILQINLEIIVISINFNVNSGKPAGTLIGIILIIAFARLRFDEFILIAAFRRMHLKGKICINVQENCSASDAF